MAPSRIGPINLEFFDSDVVGIIGRNGSGKSTLLRLMGGVFPPDEGEISIVGTISLLAGVGVGFNKNLTGLENTYLYASLMGWKKKQIDAKVDELRSETKLYKTASVLEKQNLFIAAVSKNDKLSFVEFFKYMRKRTDNLKVVYPNYYLQ